MCKCLPQSISEIELKRLQLIKRKALNIIQMNVKHIYKRFCVFLIINVIEIFCHSGLHNDHQTHQIVC